MNTYDAKTRLQLIKQMETTLLLLMRISNNPSVYAHWLHYIWQEEADYQAISVPGECVPSEYVEEEEAPLTLNNPVTMSTIPVESRR